ncbi:MAG: MmoB/DmpM family protein [Candidatus Binatia bacterium]
MSEAVGAPRETVAFVLMRGEEGEAAVSMFEGSDQPGLRIRDNGVYYTVEAPGRLEIDLDELSDRVGRPIDVSSFLVVLSTFVGRIEITGNKIAVCTEMLDLEPAAPRGGADGDGR